MLGAQTIFEYPQQRQHMCWLRDKKNDFLITHSYLEACQYFVLLSLKVNPVHLHVFDNLGLYFVVCCFLSKLRFFKNTIS